MHVINTSDKKIPVFLGQVDEWQDTCVDLAKIYHLLITGVAGCGKSTLIHNIMNNIITHTSPSAVRLILADPKIVDLSIYNKQPHLLLPVLTSVEKVPGVIDWCLHEAANRLGVFLRYGVRNIIDYNEKNTPELPHIIFIYDGYSSAQYNINEMLSELLTIANQTGIHLILSSYNTQGLKDIVNLIPARACFRSTTKLRINGISDKVLARLPMYNMYYLDQFAQEPMKLVVPDILYDSYLNKLKSSAIEQSVNVNSQPKALQEQTMAKECYDDYFVRAGHFVIEKEKGSIGMLQRAFKIGFNHATRIMDQLCEAGVVGEEEDTKPREVIMTLQEFEKFLKLEKLN